MTRQRKNETTDVISKYKSKYSWITDSKQFLDGDLLVCDVPISYLKENPKNWRIHSQRQRATYRAFKEKHGWLGLCLFNLRSGLIVDGHLRISEAVKADEKTVPCVLIDKDEDSENDILATFDNIGLLAQRNEQALKSITKSVDAAIGSIKTENDRKLKQLRKDLLETEFGSKPILEQAKSRLRPIKEEPPEEEEEEPSAEPDSHYESPDYPEDTVQTVINTDIYFDGLTEMGIPELSKENLATPDLVPTCTFPDDPESAYHCYSQTFDGTYYPGCIGFYTDDSKFEAVYNQADDFIEWAQQIQPKVLIGPDFSCYTHWPIAKSMWNLYRARWCTRLWQQFNFKVIPNVPAIDLHPYVLTTKYCLETLPTRATLAIQCRTTSNEPEAIEYLVRWVNKIIDVCNPECLVLYAGLEKQKYLIGDIKYNKKRNQLAWLPQIITVKRKRYS